MTSEGAHADPLAAPVEAAHLAHKDWGWEPTEGGIWRRLCACGLDLGGHLSGAEAQDSYLAHLTAVVVAAVNETLGAETVTEWGIQSLGEVWAAGSLAGFFSDRQTAVGVLESRLGDRLVTSVVTTYRPQRTDWAADAGGDRD